MASKLGGTNQDRVKREAAVRDRMFKKEKDVLNKTMGVSLRAMDREYAELLKKQTELVTVKSGINYFKDTDDAQRKSMRGTSSRSNLAAASNRQLQQLYVQDKPETNQTSSGHSLLPDKSTKGKLSAHNLQATSLSPSKGANPDRTTPGIKKRAVDGTSPTKQVHMDNNKPGTSGVGKVKQENKPTAGSATPDTAKKSGKGKGKSTAQKTAADKSPDEQKPTRENGSQDSDHPPRKKSVTQKGSKARRESITGQAFNREDMEEQQKILDLFIHMVEKVDDTVFDPADTTARIKDGSRASMHDKTGSPGSHHQTQVPNARKGSILQEDPRLMKDLQGILEYRRKSTDAHGTPTHITDGVEGAPTPQSRGGKRRMSGMEMISDIIGVYKTQYVKDVSFDPLAMLNCGYLRLSDSNVRELERLCREQGIDPGIHAHSNVDDFVLFPERH